MIAVAGATGTVGGPLVAELLARGVTPRLLVRPGSPTVDRLAGRAEVVPVDLADPAPLRAALTGVRRMFLMTPFRPDQGVVQLGMIDAAAQAGVTEVVKLSALGAAPDAPASVQREHGRADAELARRGLAHAVLRPNAFMQNVRQWRGTIDRFGAVALPAGSARVSMIDARDIAAVAAELLTAPVFRPGGYDLTGPAALSYADVAAVLSAVSGRPIRHWDLSTSAMAVLMREAGVPEWAIAARLDLYDTYRRGEAETVTTTVAELTGRPARTFDAYADEIAGWLSGPAVARQIR